MARVNIMGAGLAGLSCALELARAGVACTLVAPQMSERAQSVMAEGGINAALDIMGEGDSPEQHFEDTMRGGVYLADPNAVRGMVEEAPGLVRDLVGLGVPFNVERGRMVQRNFGGQKKKRTAYAKSSTGKALVTALVDAVRRYEARGLVERFGRHELAQLWVEEASDGRVCSGATVRNVYTGALEELPGPVVLCTGGYGGLFGPRNTGTTVNTGDATALAFAAGAACANLEFVQYHPTTVPITGKRMLISEAARGEGGRLFALRNGQPWYFMEEKYPELGNLMPRDVVSREEHAVMKDPACTGQVWLDMRHLPASTWAHRLSDLREECIHYLALDPARKPIPVEPGLHYCMGGLYVDAAHRTTVGGLYAAGECACQYHGANRLGGNSLLGAIYGGRMAARTVMSETTGVPMGTGQSSRKDVPSPCAPEPSPVPGPAAVIPADAEVDVAMQRVLDGALGITRDGAALEQARAQLAELAAAPGISARMANRLLLAQAAVACALARQESRGAHQRADFPATADSFKKTTVVRRAEGAAGAAVDGGATAGRGPVTVAFEPIPEDGGGVR